MILATGIIILASIALGYVIGLLQNGININHNSKEDEAPTEYNKSIGNSDFKDYYEETGGINKF